MPSIGRKGPAAQYFASTYKQLLLQPGITAQQRNSSLGGITPKSFGSVRVQQRQFADSTAPNYTYRRATDPFEGFSARFGEARAGRVISRIRTQAANDLQAQITANLFARRAGSGGILTTSGIRRRRGFSPTATLSQTTTLGG